jgi:electron transfer flavoprotein-quinone oxidoreductase
LEGANFAIASGIAAAETIKSARLKGDFPKPVLAEYKTRLKKSFVLEDLKNHQGALDVLSNQHLYSTYPELISRFCQQAYTVNSQPRRMLWKVAVDVIKESRCSFWQIIKDMIKVALKL